MATAGYSGTPLWKKLGIKPTNKIFAVNAPGDYATFLQWDVSHQMSTDAESADLIHLFAKNRNEFEEEMKLILPITRENKDINVWVSWYKKSAGIATDLTEDVIRNFALKNGLIDVKVCAVSDVWSGLKLVVPLALRTKRE